MPNSTASTRGNHHCKACNNPDSDQMVSCCHCGTWWHYACVGVNDSISESDRTFTCPECQKSSLQVQSACRLKSKVSSKASSTSSTVSTRTRQARLRLEQLEAQKALAMKRLEFERREQERQQEQKKKEAEMLLEQQKRQKEAELDQLQLQLEQTMLNESFRLRELIELEGEENDGESVTSEQSSFSKVSKWKAANSTILASTGKAPDVDPNSEDMISMARGQARQEGIRQPTSHIREVLRKETSGISLGNNVLEQTLGGLVGRTESTIIPNLVREQPVSSVAPVGTQGPSNSSVPIQKSHIETSYNHTVPYRSEVPLYQSLVVNNGMGPSNNTLSLEGNQNRDGQRNCAMTFNELLGNSRQLPRGQPPPLRQQPQVLQSPGIDEQMDWEPTPRQLAARHVVSKELPTFSGNPEDWPLFISSYTNSTRACGFSHTENLARLQKCLKGHALESVRSRLLLPAGVPHVLDTLHTLYGRPELLIHTLLQKIRTVPAPKQDRLDTLIGFGMAVQNLSDHLEAGRHEAHLNNPMLLFELVEKLPAHLKLDWSIYKQRCVEANLRTFSQYMQTLVRAATDVTLNYDPKQQPPQMSARGNKDKNFCGAHLSEGSTLAMVNREAGDNTTRSPSPSCLICKSPEHRVKDCAEFIKKTIDERWKTIQQFTLCRICLGAHGRRPCKSRKQCEIEGCQRRHHPFLHSRHDQSHNMQIKESGKSEKKENKQGSSETKPSGTKSVNQPTVSNHHCTGKTTLFRIIPVTLHGHNCSVSVYAFLDDGSEKTLIDEDVVKKLGLVGEPQALCLQWTANVKRMEANSRRVTLKISGRTTADTHILSDVRTVRQLDLPRQSLRYAELAKTFPYLKGLPVEEYDNALPRILIGNDNAHVTSTLKIRDGRPGEPIAVKSRLGWTVYGSKQDRSVENAHNFHVCECQETDASLQGLVEQFFSVESLGIMEVERAESTEVQRANKILEETTKRVGQRFETGLLWKYDSFEFPDSYPMAVRRLQCLERRMQTDPVISESVKRQISEYQTKGYMHKATQEELNDADPRRTWYVPLGVTINPKKPSKIRIFCDAAAKVDGISLNTFLLKGPDLLIALLDVLFGFREKRIAVCADLKEMFHQLLMRTQDRNAQRVLMREHPSQVPDVYLMDVVTFGATCSPSSAQYVKNRNAEEHAEQYPEATNAIIRKHYVDDYLDSMDSVEEAVKLSLEVRHVHSLGGFHLRNWISNSKEVLARVGESEPVLERCLLLDKSGSTERVLGMYWKPQEDVFTFSATLASETEHPTKRQALRIVMSLFDPLGLLSFFLIHGKVLIQEMWRAKTEWDQPIPERIFDRWTQWTKMFRLLDKINIPRCYFLRNSVKNIGSLQLHIYVDASEEAYAAVAYWRAVLPSGIRVTLISGKSKVAPLKALSVPRLELMAAVIGVRLMKTIVKGHSLVIEKVVFWSDSKTVLAWINSDHRNYRQFVACRVGEILSKSKAEQWRWVPTKKNVADEATKWGKGPCLTQSGRWFRGEDDLYLPEDQWTANTHPLDKTTEELRACMVHQKIDVPQFINWERYSKWTRLTRAVAYVHRYAQNLRRTVHKEVRATGSLTQMELNQAEITILRWVQHEHFPDEVATLTAKYGKRRQVSLEKSSKIRKLSPYLDEVGIIRSDSRIATATFASFDTKFPTILPKEHRVTRLLVEWYHQRYLHANGETVVNELRQRFHIPHMRTVVRRVAKECMTCKLKKAIPEVPRMAPFPEARLQPYVRPFSFVGIDYFGPIGVRVNRSIAKRWVALFTCLTTRAVHLEVVHTLTSESCKMAIRRFIGRRGAPVEIRSDRGTNFVGCSNELKKELDSIDCQLARTFTNANTKWVFNPPGAPHMGGAWERLVRSVKVALAAMDTSRNPSEETLATVLVEAESVVNSRPLTYIPLETSQQEAITPNHFLLLSSSGVAQPPRTTADPKQACRTDWNLCRLMVDQFWRRWVREYLPTIARRTKWFEDVKPVEVGDLVMLVEEKTRNGWIRGRVTNLAIGKDGRVRDAVVQTANGLVHRPMAKLALLDVGDSKAGPERNPDQPYGSGNCCGNLHRIPSESAGGKITEPVV